MSLHQGGSRPNIVTAPFAHSGHWLTSVAYFVPVVAFLIWLLVAHIQERRKSGESKRPRPR